MMELKAEHLRLAYNCYSHRLLLEKCGKKGYVEHKGVPKKFRGQSIIEI